MRLVIQRVSQASVSTEARGVVGEIGKGLCVLVGIGDGDDTTDMEWCKKQILTTKFWPDDNDKPWKKDLSMSDYQVLLVSQFTLYAKVYKKGKLDFHCAMPPGPAKVLYDTFVESIRSEIGIERTQEGEFGEYMQVDITNDGPVTVVLDSPPKNTI